MITEQQKNWMREAIALSMENIDNGGGPFGAVIVKDGVVVAPCSSCVTAAYDPSAHAAVLAKRQGSTTPRSFALPGCAFSTPFAPCPMCLSAIYWAHIDRIFYANTQYDAKEIDFDDSFIYTQLSLDPTKRSIPAVRVLGDEAIAAFRKWQVKEDKIAY